MKELKERAYRYAKEDPTEKLLPQGLQDMLSTHRKYTAQANDINNEIMEREMKTLHLPLKAKWYEMIESGVKTEEYREIKPYWVQRLCPCTHYCSNGHFSERYFHCIFDCKAFHGHMNYYRNGKRIGAHTRVKFSYGYTHRTMTFEIESITIGKGNPEWGAPDKEVFIIKLGKRI